MKRKLKRFFIRLAIFMERNPKLQWLSLFLIAAGLTPLEWKLFDHMGTSAFAWSYLPMVLADYLMGKKEHSTFP